MSLLAPIKSLSISTGLYRPARWLARRLRGFEHRLHAEKVAFYRSLVPAGSLCFDVGANTGEMSEALIKAGQRVVAFEPNPLVIPELKARVGAEKDWTLIAAAVGSGGAILSFNATRDTVTSSLSMSRLHESEIVRRYHVPVVTLDAAIKEFGVPAYCKIDVEGWELEVLKGLSQPVPLMSFEFKLHEEGVARTRACLARLGELGRWSVNLTPAERSYFFLEEWQPLDRFAAEFPGDLAERLPDDTYGDIFLRHEP